MNPTQRSRLTLSFIVGQNEFGENVTKSKTFNNIKGTATDEALTDVVEAFIALIEHPLADATRLNSYSLM